MFEFALRFGRSARILFRSGSSLHNVMILASLCYQYSRYHVCSTQSQLRQSPSRYRLASGQRGEAWQCVLDGDSVRLTGVLPICRSAPLDPNVREAEPNLPQPNTDERLCYS